jgi:hypothetical protein
MCMTALPSEVRKTILDDHRWLREFLADVGELARRVSEGDRSLAGRLRERAEALRERFLGHLDLEEQHLAPALRDTPGWGRERAEALRREHAAQRQRFETLVADLRDARRSPRDIAVEVGLLVRALLADMEHEEKTLLSPAVLRDDPMTIGEPE